MNHFRNEKGRKDRLKEIGHEKDNHVSCARPKLRVLQYGDEILEPNEVRADSRHIVLKRQRKAPHDGIIIEHQKERERGKQIKIASLAFVQFTADFTELFFSLFRQKKNRRCEYNRSERGERYGVRLKLLKEREGPEFLRVEKFQRFPRFEHQERSVRR